jgi:nucleotide-binding universal stress UspA family protein
VPYKDVFAIVASHDEECVFQAAEALARQAGAHVAVAHLSELPETFVDPVGATTSAWVTLVEETRALAAEERKKIAERLRRSDALTELRPLESPRALVSAAVAEQALHADITLMKIPDNDFAQAAFEGALFNAGRPVLVLPAKWRGNVIGENVLIAWKPVREAARAVADAMPFITTAKKVTVLTVDAKPDGYGQGPGRDIATHLARYGARVDVRNADGLGRFAEDAILEEAQALKADLVVMGGYGHGRLTEFVFGGVTRALSRTSPLPVFMSH